MENAKKPNSNSRCAAFSQKDKIFAFKPMLPVLHSCPSFISISASSLSNFLGVHISDILMTIINITPVRQSISLSFKQC